jgi:tripeptidyl-peptidase-1
MPSYQSSDVQNYISGLNGDSNGLYNSNGRGYPDVSLIGLNLDIVYQGSVTQIGGTSASSPEWAALFRSIRQYDFWPKYRLFSPNNGYFGQ